MIYREKQYNDTLCHFNKNHDPRNGRFAKNASAAIVGGSIAGAIAGSVVKRKSIKKLGRVISMTTPEQRNRLVAGGTRTQFEIERQAMNSLSNKKAAIAAGSAAIAAALAIIGTHEISEYMKSNKKNTKRNKTS